MHEETMAMLCLYKHTRSCIGCWRSGPLPSTQIVGCGVQKEADWIEVESS